MNNKIEAEFKLMAEHMYIRGAEQSFEHIINIINKQPSNVRDIIDKEGILGFIDGMRKCVLSSMKENMVNSRK